MSGVAAGRVCMHAGGWCGGVWRRPAVSQRGNLVPVMLRSKPCGGRGPSGRPLGREWYQTLRLCMAVAEPRLLFKAIEFQEWRCTA